MVSPGSLGKFTPGKPNPLQYGILVAVFVLFGAVGGYFAGIQPVEKWRFFSWHPLLMTIGMVTIPGTSAITKKLGGYTNTKLHGIIAWLGIIFSFAGLYAIYKNKENNGFKHLQSNHALAGLFVMVNYIGLGLVGGIVLHPDFGVDKTNGNIRLAHKMAGRLVIMLGWANAFLGLYQMNVGQVALCLYGLPLLLLIPFSLL